MTVQVDLCRTWSETTLLVFPRDGSFSDDTGASFVTAGDRTLPDNAGGGDMDETIENAGDDRSQDESEDG